MLHDANWDIYSVSALSAVRMLIDALQSLSNITGDIPPTPPVSRPTTPKSNNAINENLPPGAQPGPSPASPVSPVSPHTTCSQGFPNVPIGSPEAHHNEPMPSIDDVGANAEAIIVQHAAISRRFYLKAVPPFSISDYLLRLHQYCPHSPGVYLAASAYVHRLSVEETLVPATPKTVHRLALAAIRVASKAFEDNKWSQDRVSKVGGVSRKELKNLEVNLCFLLGFDLFIREEELRRRMFLLQQAARQGMSLRRKLSDGFSLRLRAQRAPEA